MTGDGLIEMQLLTVSQYPQKNENIHNSAKKYSILKKLIPKGN